MSARDRKRDHFDLKINKGSKFETEQVGGSEKPVIYLPWPNLNAFSSSADYQMSVITTLQIQTPEGQTVCINLEYTCKKTL